MSLTGRELPEEQLVAIDSDVLHHVLDRSGATFAPLPTTPAAPATEERLLQSFQAVFGEIRTPVVSAWGEHIPFLFGLISLLRPRRIVELGVHHGGSFLAACQAVQDLGLESECIAIDNWIGEHHAGKTNVETTFLPFRQYLEELYSDCAGYIKADFDEASLAFEDGSIDLLHIDGLHTSESVQHDFDTWMGKLSDHGIVLLHDTNEFKRDFGVWRFWQKIRRNYPHIELKHGHGLGLLIVGEHSPLHPSAGGLAAWLSSDQGKEWIQVLFGGIGPAFWSQANTKVQLANTEGQLDNAETRLANTEVRLANTEVRLANMEVQLATIREGHKNVSVERDIALQQLKTISKRLEILKLKSIEKRKKLKKQRDKIQILLYRLRKKKMAKQRKGQKFSLTQNLQRIRLGLGHK
ncbi:MAG: hypothetical protein GY807_14750 [Gammaproteobacteria bacterium]|nr:hypothetical protein [Gammaproteobacteria bacterium]